MSPQYLRHRPLQIPFLSVSLIVVFFYKYSIMEVEQLVLLSSFVHHMKAACRNETEPFWKFECVQELCAFVEVIAQFVAQNSVELVPGMFREGRQGKLDVTPNHKNLYNTLASTKIPYFETKWKGLTPNAKQSLVKRFVRLCCGGANTRFYEQGCNVALLVVLLYRAKGDLCDDDFIFRRAAYYADKWYGYKLPLCVLVFDDAKLSYLHDFLPRLRLPTDLGVQNVVLPPPSIQNLVLEKAYVQSKFELNKCQTALDVE